MIQPLIKNKLAITSPIRKLIRIDTLLYQALLFNNNLIETITMFSVVVKNKWKKILTLTLLIAKFLEILQILPWV
jgi:hypothetical protein